MCNNTILSLSRFLVCNPSFVVARFSAAPCLALVQNRTNFPHNVPEPFKIQFRQYAARKGTRTKKEKKKVKKEIVKKVFIFAQRRKLAKMEYQQQRPVENLKLPIPVDDVFPLEKFSIMSYSFAEAVQNHKDIHHPTMYNIPNSPLILRVDIDLVYPNRPNKFQDGWSNIVEMKARFLTEHMTEPSVLAFCPGNDSELIEEAIKAGADTAGSNELIKSIQEGLINPEDFDYFVTHPSMVTDLTAIRGLIKKKFPTIKAKTINVDIPAAVRRLKSGIQIKLIKNDREPDFGYIETPIGKLDMEISDLEGNFEAVFFDTVARRVPNKTPESFILRCSLTTPHTSEVLKIDINRYFSMVEDVKKKPIGQAAIIIDEDENKETEIASAKAQ